MPEMQRPSDAKDNVMKENTSGLICHGYISIKWNRC